MSRYVHCQHGKERILKIKGGCTFANGNAVFAQADILQSRLPVLPL